MKNVRFILGMSAVFAVGLVVGLALNDRASVSVSTATTADSRELNALGVIPHPPQNISHKLPNTLGSHGDGIVNARPGVQEQSCHQSFVQLAKENQAMMGELVEIRKFMMRMDKRDTSQSVKVANAKQNASTSRVNHYKEQLLASRDPLEAETTFHEIDFLLDLAIEQGGDLDSNAQDVRYRMSLLDSAQRMDIRIKITEAINQGKVPGDFYYRFF